MSRLEDAVMRFSAALDRLEVEADRRLSRERESHDAATELTLLRSEREQLIARIAGLEEESRNLASLTEEVENRLDGAIAEIRDVLGQN